MIVGAGLVPGPTSDLQVPNRLGKNHQTVPTMTPLSCHASSNWLRLPLAIDGVEGEDDIFEPLAAVISQGGDAAFEDGAAVGLKLFLGQLFHQAADQLDAFIELFAAQGFGAFVQGGEQIGGG
jgi:hypothetical protein